jgi:glutamyl-tRNA synthetase
MARSAGGAFVVRMEDLDRANSSAERAETQLADLAALGLDWEGEVWFQSERFDHYRELVRRLAAADVTYPCFCTRREIRDALAAPHADTFYPGACRTLSAAARDARARVRPPAIRLRANATNYTFDDLFAGRHHGCADDVVLVRNDGVPAYQLAVVADDAAQGVTQVVRGDDLLEATPTQLHLQQLLGFGHPSYAHVPLVVAASGERLAKRHGAVTIPEAGGPAAVRSWIAVSLGLAEPGEPVSGAAMLDRFRFDLVPRTPIVWDG